MNFARIGEAVTTLLAALLITFTTSKASDDPFNDIFKKTSDPFDIFEKELVSQNKFISFSNARSIDSIKNEIIRYNTLDLSNSTICYLPPSLGNFLKLTTLDINNSYINDLPSTIGALTNLTSLDLLGLTKVTIPTEIGNLVNLKIFSTPSDGLPTEICQLTKLTHLTINTIHVAPSSVFKSCRRPQSGNYTLPLEIFNLKKLKEIKIRKSEIEKGRAHIICWICGEKENYSFSNHLLAGKLLYPQDHQANIFNIEYLKRDLYIPDANLQEHLISPINKTILILLASQHDPLSLPCIFPQKIIRLIQFNTLQLSKILLLRIMEEREHQIMNHAKEKTEQPDDKIRRRAAERRRLRNTINNFHK